LERCMILGTSNANESLHSMIWRRAPKAVFSSRKIVEIAVAMGIVQFNKGAQIFIDATAAVVPQAGPSCQLSKLVGKMDKTRLRKSDAAAKLENKSSRKRLCVGSPKLQAEAKQSEEEGHLYNPGAW
ncbi:hypothetical protein LSAT2_019165, partial [Lamellibrachia satsuma]